MDKDINLGDMLIEFEKTATQGTTVDDFFDYAGVPTHQRTDFVFCTIMKQAKATKRTQEAFTQADEKFKTRLKQWTSLKSKQCQCASWPNGKGAQKGA